MTRCVVDTNVPIVANGTGVTQDAQAPSIDCRLAAVTFLQAIIATGTVLLDVAGAIQEEYRRHLNPAGQPGVGDRFYQIVLHSAPHLVERSDLPKRQDGEYVDVPPSLVGVGFDPSDRKFVAMARRNAVPVVNATDSDWIEHSETLAAEGVVVRHLCGLDTTAWFVG